MSGLDGMGPHLTYILPLRTSTPQIGELTEYLRWLSARAEIIVVDGSERNIFATHAAVWNAATKGAVRHVAPAPDLATPMGKVGGVLTGLRLASHERVIIADDDVRYDADGIERVEVALLHADVVRPQNYFSPLPWHARWDTGRMLLNRMTGGDWPGTLGVRRSVLAATDGYDGRAMFENLELVRTVIAAGGREAVLLDVFVLRRPASTAQFWSQRVRQAYDEFARPARLAVSLALGPAVLLLAIARHWTLLALAVGGVVLLAELGRRRAHGTAVFPFSTSLFAPAWLAERAVCSWLALASRVIRGGVKYRGTVLRHAATPLPVLMARHAAVRARLVREVDRAPRHRSA